MAFTTKAPRFAAVNALTRGAAGDDTNSGCHGNLDGVQPNDKVILSHPRLMVLCWGKFYQDHPDALDNAVALCKDLVTGPYLNGLAQYGVGRGSIAGSARVNFGPAPATLSEDEARDQVLEFVRTIGPAPVKDED